LGLKLTPMQEEIAGPILHEVRQRLNFLDAVGLEYLTLDRLASTLSGGEAQRIQLATSLGSRLVGALYVLDEPSIGLHTRDTARLIRILEELRDLGNTILVVEHDAEVLRAADHLLDLGPGAGEFGGKLLAEGCWRRLRPIRTR
jgi:excinuclease ABC subunit A